MKAKNEKGIISICGTIPVNYNSNTLGMVLGFDKLDSATHEAEGFFDVIIPQYDPYTEALGAIYFDQAARVFTYYLETLAKPLPRPVPELYISQNEMIKRFTLAEFTGILTAAKTNVFIEYWVFRFNSLKSGVNILDTETIEGLNQLETAGLIAAGRAAEILAV